MIQVRDVPDDLHRELVRRARSRGLTLTADVEEILRREVGRPPREEVFRRIESHPRVKSDVSSVELLHRERALRSGI